MSENILFRDTIGVTAVNRDGKKFDRVSRISAKSEAYDCELTLDVNTEIYPIENNEKFYFTLSRTLALDGSVDTGKELWRGNTKSLADDYDYVMHGKCYKVEDASGPGANCNVYVSYGGLLMCLNGSFKYLSNITKGANVYLLMRKA